jgi:hypothetical protein
VLPALPGSYYSQKMLRDRETNGNFSGLGKSFRPGLSSLFYVSAGPTQQ